ncbi:MAG: ribokinase, partial [Chloroflexota bacterium]|nr:ribokinase [Chloroflexota bacterium]
VHTDLIATAPRRPRRGETVLGTAFASHPGGKGGNQAAQAALQGCSTALVGRVGRDAFGERLLDALRSKGVRTELVEVDDEAATGVSTVLVGGDGDYASVVVPGASDRIDRAQIDAAEPAIAACRVLLAQLEIDVQATTHVARLAKALGKTVVLNAAPAPTGATEELSDLWCCVDVVVANRGEAAALLGVDEHARASPGEVARALRERLGTAAVVVTLGGDGAVLATASGEHAVPGFAVSVMDTVGAGDAFVGTLTSRLARRTYLVSALGDANAAGAIAVTRAGAFDALPTAAELDHFLNRGTVVAEPGRRR